MLILNFLTKYGIYIIFFLLSLFLLVFLLFYLYNYAKNEYKGFDENLKEAKEIQIEININFTTKKVLKYYLYNPKIKKEIITLDEFFLRFDHNNVEKLKKWLKRISEIADIFKIKHQEFVMYDESNYKRVFNVELESFDLKRNIYCLLFKDVTDEISVLRRAGKIETLNETDDFFNNSNLEVSSMNSGETSYLCVIKYKERDNAIKELKPEVLKLLDDLIFKKLSENAKENELLSISINGFFLLFFKTPLNQTKFKKDLKDLLLACSGTYDMVKNKFSYSVSLYAGFMPLTRNDKVSMDRALDVATAADAAMKKSIFSDRIEGYDVTLETLKSERNYKLVQIENIIMEGHFKVRFLEICDAINKNLIGFDVKVEIPFTLGISMEEFNDLVRKRFFRTIFYGKVFNELLKHYEKYNYPHYLTFPFEDLERVCNAFALDEKFENINIYFCSDISNETIHNYSVSDIDKIISGIKEKNKVKLGLSFASNSPISLIANIYEHIDVIMLSNSLITSSTDSFIISSLITQYTKIAHKYQKDIIALDVNNNATFDLLVHLGIYHFGGLYLANYLKDGIIKEKRIIKEIDDVVNRKY